jgi:hypothetical protein
MGPAPVVPGKQVRPLILASNPAVPTRSSNLVGYRSRHFCRINSSVNSPGGSISADPDLGVPRIDHPQFGSRFCDSCPRAPQWSGDRAVVPKNVQRHYVVATHR